MRAVRRNNLTSSFDWVGSDGWSGRLLVSEGNELEVEGTLAFLPQAHPVAGFDDYFLSLTPQNNKRNPWFIGKQSIHLVPYRCIQVQPFPYLTMIVIPLFAQFLLAAVNHSRIDFSRPVWFVYFVTGLEFHGGEGACGLTLWWRVSHYSKGQVSSVSLLALSWLRLDFNRALSYIIHRIMSLFVLYVEFWEHHFQCRYPSSPPTPYNQVSYRSMWWLSAVCDYGLANTHRTVDRLIRITQKKFWQTRRHRYS